MANNPRYEGVTEVGVGANKVEDSRPTPLIDDAGDYEYITLLNPLPFTFKGQVALSRQVNAPLQVVDGALHGVDEQVLRQAGLNLKNPEHPSNMHIPQEVVIPSGQTLNILGPEAKVIIRQLVNEILAYRGQVTWQGSPAYRRKVEEEIVVSRRGLDELANVKPAETVEDVPKETSEEPAFPTLKKETKAKAA